MKTFLVDRSLRVLAAVHSTGARGERGQIMMEYVLLTFACVLGLLGFSVVFQRAIKSYLLGIYFFVGLPVP